MSADVIALADHLRKIHAQLVLEPDDARETILLEEGLGLLATYTKIADRSLRLLLKALIETVARDDVPGGSSCKGNAEDLTF